MPQTQRILSTLSLLVTDSSRIVKKRQESCKKRSLAEQNFEDQPTELLEILAQTRISHYEKLSYFLVKINFLSD